MNARAALANLGWLTTSLPAHRRFIRALRDPAATQTAWLRAHLARNKSSAYARSFGVSEKFSYAAFARNFPVTTYEDLTPWISRIRRGEQSVLTSEPVTRLVPTSGSSGARKLIPFTATLQREFNAALGSWLVDLCAQHPSMAFGSAYWSVTPMDDVVPTESSAIPIGFADDTEYLGGTRAWLIDGAMAVPSSVRRITDLRAFRHTVLLHLLQRADLRFISVWHPSFLSLLLETLQRDWSLMLAELAKARPHRAAELRDVNSSEVRSIWPRLSVVSCWSDANAQGPSAELGRRLTGVTIQPKGLLATEAFVTIPFRSRYPVAIGSHFFEFRDDAGAVHLTEDLRVGHSYEVIVTTGGGLWRYCLGDRVEVIGLVERTPTLRFLGRGGNVSDRCGEKLTEAFVTEVLAALCPSAPFAMLAPECDHGVWRYTLYLETSSKTPLEPGTLDAALSANPHYALCRRLGQLAMPRLIRVRNGYSRFTAAEMSRGMRLGDIKPAALSQRTDWAGIFAAESETVPQPR